MSGTSSLTLLLTENPLQTSVGQSNLFVHLDPDLFPEPHSFKPERWLNGKTEDGELLDHWLVTFGKGPRSCLGIKYVILLAVRYCVDDADDGGIVSDGAI